MVHTKILVAIMLVFCMTATINSRATDKPPRQCCCSSTTARANRNYCSGDDLGEALCDQRLGGSTHNICDVSPTAFDYFLDTLLSSPECPDKSTCEDYCAQVPAGAHHDGCLDCCLFCCPNSGD